MKRVKHLLENHTEFRMSSSSSKGSRTKNNVQYKGLKPDVEMTDMNSLIEERVSNTSANSPHLPSSSNTHNVSSLPAPAPPPALASTSVSDSDPVSVPAFKKGSAQSLGESLSNGLASINSLSLRIPSIHKKMSQRREIRDNLRIQKKPDKINLINGKVESKSNSNFHPAVAVTSFPSFSSHVTSSASHKSGVDNLCFPQEDRDRVYKETTEQVISNRYEYDPDADLNFNTEADTMARYREEMSEVDPLRGSEDWSSNPERNGLFKRHKRTLQWAIFFGAMAVSVLVFMAVLAIVLQLAGAPPPPSTPVAPALPNSVLSPLPEHPPLASTSADVKNLLTRSWPVDDLRTREANQFKGQFLPTLKASPTSNKNVNVHPVPVIIPVPVFKTDEKVADAHVVSLGVKSGREAEAARERVEKEMMELKMTVSPSSPSAQLTVAEVNKTEEEQRRAAAGFFMDKASQAISQQLKLTKEEAQGGIVTDDIKDFQPNEFCSGSASSLQTVTCNMSDIYRSFDGSCNNLRHTTWGASNAPYRRILLPDYADGISKPRVSSDGSELPSPRLISTTLFNSDTSNAPLATFMLVLWGHFVDHDLVQTSISTGFNNTPIACCSEGKLSDIQHPECFPFTMTPKDQFYGPVGQQCTNFVRSAPSPVCQFGPREQENKLTAFLDASTLYGSTFNESKAARRGFPIPVEPDKGRLPHSWIDDGRPLPYRSVDLNDGCNRPEKVEKKEFCFKAGDKRINEYLGTTTMNLVWSRQHNEVVEHLMSLNPGWDSNTLFHESRRIVIAQIQHITYNEFLPVLLGPSVMKASGLQLQKDGYYTGYDQDVDPSISNAFSAAAFRLGHSMIQGLITMVGPRWKNEDYIQIHKLFYNPFPLYKLGKMDAILRGHASFPARNPDLHFSKQVTEHLFQRNGSYGLDLGSIDIQRGRDHGIGNYVSWRAICGLSEVKDFSDLTGVWPLEAVVMARTIYKSVYDIDLYVGGLAEHAVPDGMVGPTFSCIIADQFLRLKKGDRFWYEGNIQMKPFTPAQLQVIRKTTLAQVLCINSDDIDSIQSRAMERISPSNPRLPCFQRIPDNTYYEAWKENMPTLDSDVQTNKVKNNNKNNSSGTRSKKPNLQSTLQNDSTNESVEAEDSLEGLLDDNDEAGERLEKEKENDGTRPSTSPPPSILKFPGKKTNSNNNNNIVMSFLPPSSSRNTSVVATNNDKNDNNSSSSSNNNNNNSTKYIPLQNKTAQGQTGENNSSSSNTNNSSGNSIEFQDSKDGIILNWHHDDHERRKREKHTNNDKPQVDEDLILGGL